MKKRSEVPKCEDCVSESKQKRRENRESKRKYIVKKRAVSEKKKRVFSLLKLYL